MEATRDPFGTDVTAAAESPFAESASRDSEGFRAFDEFEEEHECGAECPRCGGTIEADTANFYEADELFESYERDVWNNESRGFDDVTPEFEGITDPVALVVRGAALMGNRDENQLTNLIFFARHPGRQGRKISPSEPDFTMLRDEWLSIRNNIVRPVLADLKSSGGSSPGGKAGPLPVVATRLEPGPGYRTMQNERQYGIPETVAALKWIAERWVDRNSGLTFMVRDISKQGGGKFGHHKSHRIGLDADVQLRTKDCPVDCTKSDYPKHRASVQELVKIIECNPILPVKAIGYMDTKIKGRTLSPWPGHDRHLHIRFCMPEPRRVELDLDKVRVKGDKKKPPSYECKPAVSRSDCDFDSEFFDDSEFSGDVESEFFDDSEFSGDVESEFFDDSEFSGDVESEFDGALYDAEDAAALGMSQFAREFEEQDEFEFAGESESAGESQLGELAVKLAIQLGNRDEASLTNMLFAARHPSRFGRALDPAESDFAALSAEWIDIRNRIVRPLLTGTGSGSGLRSSAGSPPGLPAWARGKGARGSALSEVRRVSAGYSLGHHFVQVCEQMAIIESGATFGKPAYTFNADPPHLRRGRKLITAWGVFQYNRDAWTARIPTADRPGKRSFVAKGVGGCSSTPGCVFPWDSTMDEEIGIPIAHFAVTYREILAGGGSPRDAAAAVRLRHKRPSTVYPDFRDRGRDHGFASAWSALSAEMRKSLETFVKGVNSRP